MVVKSVGMKAWTRAVQMVDWMGLGWVELLVERMVVAKDEPLVGKLAVYLAAYLVAKLVGMKA